jgi:uncharacterized protein YecT (DUF1311 family)
MKFGTKATIRAAALSLLLVASSGCDWMQKKEGPQVKGENERRREREAQLRRACASELTYDRLKEYAFDEAQRIRGRDAELLDQVANASVVRMEEPVVKSRDEALNVTVCSGRFVLELPPGAENAFDGARRLTADVEYSAQAAVDGSGLVYHLTGAEPIIYRLATIGGLPSGLRTVQAAPGTSPPAARPAPSPPAPAPAPAPSPAAEPRPEPRAQPPAPPRTAEERQARAPRPSYSCRHASTRTEIMVCANPSLAAADRRMASVYYAEMARADGSIRQQLRRSRDRFLSRREGCRNEACVAAAYEERVREIRAIAGR